jgi:hypothetical protein
MLPSIDLDRAGVRLALSTEACSPTPLTQQLAGNCGFRAWLRQWRDESPCWLVSLIVHLVVVLLVMSSTVPWMPANGQGSGSISLTIGFADRTQHSQGPEVTLPSEPTVTSGQSETDPTEQPTTSTDRASVAEARRQSASAPSESAAPSPRERAASSQSVESTTADDKSWRVSRYAALLNRRRPLLGASTARLTTALPVSDAPLDPQQVGFDQIVDDFIAYDVGRLRGTAGMQARQRFAELGPDALPALVRGLNRAAGLHASCPVGVIAGKLIATLRTASDPSLRQYAIDNIGAGVPEDAPHYARLVALRKNWLDAPAMPANVAVIVERLEDRQEGELMELMLSLSGAPSDTLVAALRSGDEYLAAAATLAIIQGPKVWDSQQQGQLRAALMHFHTVTANAQIRALIGDAINTLHR